MAFYEEFEHLKIQLEEIKSATNSFAEDKVIGNGGFGKVYKGEISHSKGRSMAAFKRLNAIFGQGDPEFWKEIMMLSRYPHENVVSLLGYCDEGGEKILVYEHASHGSLDQHLGATSLTWIQRFKICLEVARGLSHLHDHHGTKQRVLHRDLKSANILLDENWNVKVSDFGLSKLAPANQPHTFLFTTVAGTPGYCDPLYMEMGFLSKESDVYSLGVVLFEVLCGRLCFGNNSDGRFNIFVFKWIQNYKENKLDELIFQDLKQQLEPSCLKTFSDIAYQCLEEDRANRPPIANVVKQLEIAFESQLLYELIGSPEKFKAIDTTAVPDRRELNMLLSKGILVNGGNTWISLNKNEQHCEMLSAADFMILKNNQQQYSSKYNSRFAQGSHLLNGWTFKVHGRARFLSPGVTYTINIVFKFIDEACNSTKPVYLGLKYKLDRKTKSSISYLADGREDGWMMVELCQFTSEGTNFDLEIQFEDSEFGCGIAVEGIEFRPREKVEHQVLEDDKVNMQDSEIDQEQKLPNDYTQIIKRSKSSLQWTTEKELYSAFRKGFLINKGEGWFSLAKNGKKCLMISPRALFARYQCVLRSQPNSRFEVMDFNSDIIFIVHEVESQLLSPQTTYACYLVYNIETNDPVFEVPMKVRKFACGSNDLSVQEFWFIYLRCPQTPLLNQSTHNPSDIPRIKGLPRKRKDGWMEVQVWEFRTSTITETNDMISMHFCLSSPTHDDGAFPGLTMQSIELIPL